METKPLEFIQAIIARMAANSTQMKTWNVGLATAAIGFVAAKDGKPGGAIYALFPAFMFWMLDGYYLAIERLYRDLYKKKVASGAPSFDLTVADPPVWPWINAMCSGSVLPVHLTVMAVIFWITGVK